MLDTAGPELQVRNKTGDPILLKMDDKVTLTADLSKSLSATIIPISYSELSKVYVVVISFRFLLLDFLFSLPIVCINLTFL